MKTYAEQQQRSIGRYASRSISSIMYEFTDRSHALDLLTCQSHNAAVRCRSSKCSSSPTEELSYSDADFNLPKRISKALIQRETYSSSE